MDDRTTETTTPAFPDGLPLVRPRIPDREAVLRRIDAVLRSGQLTDGPTVRELEAQAAEMLGVREVVAVASCTTGLLLVCQALGMTGRVVVPSFTFSATAHVVAWNGGTPVFADVDRATLTIDAADVERRLDGATGILATHLYGTPCDTEALEKVANRAGLPLVFDAAHALGSRKSGVPVGRFGAAEVFSMSPTKVAVAGEGGLVATDDTDLAQRLRVARNYGNPGDYDCVVPGLNGRMSELHAALAVEALVALDEDVRHRNTLAAAFHDALAGVPGISVPAVSDGDTSTFKDLAIIVEPDAYGLDADALAAALSAEGIDSRRYYHPPVHRQAAYADAAATELPVTEWAARRTLCVPLWSTMDEPTVRLVADVVRRSARPST